MYTKEKLKEYEHQWYLLHKDEVYLRAETRRKSQRNKILEYKATHPCVICGESDPCVLDFHHVDPNGKEFTVAEGMNYTMERIMKEIEKCDIVCKNCHAKIHAGKLRKVGGVWLNASVC